ncbi:exodeoxyribonuclease V subunit gamma [Ramlibacter sp. 2FC]|uniref:exodeoxyribonuclease V subunit gamma n=1 Tax=Ramlibacter sp. 2FC TaxID=2502188 RepID=UPI0010F65C6D|nr:exodeoxyribonuclease V subunit gamma [Ramlibacter sp. 2FC]
MHFSLPPGFMVVHGNRLEDLRDLAVDFVKAHPLPPLLPEVFLVQSNGMKHWLELALAREEALGICAATRMELPGRLLWEVYRSVLGQEAVPEQMPFDKTALAWRLVRLLPELAAQDEAYAPLRRYLAGDADGRRRYQLALQLADVFDGYQSYRSDWLDDWAQGQDLLRGPTGSRPLPPAHAWQARLWRALRADVGEDLAQASRASVHARFMRALQAHDTTGPRPAGVPPRIVVFGISSLPQQTVEALAALGRVCQVLMLVQNPCRHHWGHVVEGRELLRPLARQRQTPKPGLPYAAPDAAELHAQAPPLLASWGKQGRDYLHLLDEFEPPEQAGAPLQRIDVFVDPLDSPGAASQLTQLQSDILELEPLPAAPGALPDDGAISLVLAHSAQREVEVLHDQLLAWFDADPSLSPREVMVMVPDMAGFLPHIQAVFGRFAPGHPRHIPFSVADRSPRQSPLVQALERLLGLPTSRITLADWLGLFEVAAVRKRFDLGEADVAQLQDWLALAGVRWGLDAAHRRAWGLPADAQGAEQNTWAFGLRRMLLGYATGGGEAWQGVLPLAEVGGLGAQLVGRLADWVDAMSLSLQELREDRPPAQWLAQLQALLERFFAPSSEAEERLLRQLAEQLAQWRRLCDEARLTQPLPLVVVREHWLAQIEAPGLQQRFFGGGVQFATLMPMRTIPFRVLCLLGMNDADYPRQAAPRDFDLMAQSWRPGDRSRREDDRYLFLEALLSAREKLYISWQGHRATDNAELPPSVLVAQLQDALKARFAQPPTPRLQPLQAFSARYFEAGSSFFSYADDWQQALAERPEAAPAAAAAEAEAEAANTPCPAELTLEALERLLRQPVEVYWRSRLGVRLEQPQEAAPEDEPFALDGLAQYQIGQALLQAPDSDLALAQLQLSGQLPMAAFGQRLAHQLQAKAQEVRARAPAWQAAYPELLAPQSLALDLGEARLTGTLRELRAGPEGWLQLAQRPGAVLEGKEGRKTPRHGVLTALWLRHVAASATGASLTSVMLGVDGQVRLAPLPADQALALLQDWLAAYRAAWSRPLPVTRDAALAYLQARAAAGEGEEGEDPALAAARQAFEGGYRQPGEWERSAYLQRSFEGFDEIEHELPHWAQRIYGPLVQEARPGQAAQPEEAA